MSLRELFQKGEDMVVSMYARLRWYLYQGHFEQTVA